MEAWHALKLANIVGHHGQTVFKSRGGDEKIHGTDGTPRRLKGGTKGRGMDCSLSGKGKYLHMLQQQAHLRAFLLSPGGRATLDAIE